MGRKASGRLGPLLCWAVVFADIGTSVYYTPGILYDHPGIGSLAPAFVGLVSIAFIFLALKYADITARYPEGGGVVTVATHAFGPLIGCLGGMLITVDYFLTSSISSMSGIRYLESILSLHGFAVPIACASVVLLGLLNWVGIKESASVTLAMALAAFCCQLAVVGITVAQLSAHDWVVIKSSALSVSGLRPGSVVTGYAAAWLAFSGLESMSQLSPAMREPRSRIATTTMVMVVGTVLVTSPLLTAFSTTILKARMSVPPRSEAFISELGGAFGGHALKVVVVVSAATLLVFAANTAIIGCYHVFLALTKQGFMPAVLARRNRRFGTPHVAIAVATGIPVAILLVTRGHIDTLGDMYAFGLLGAFTLSALGLDIVRWRDHQRGPMFWVGALTTLLVFVAWVTNLFAKHLATIFGGGVVALGMGLAYLVRRGYFARLERIGFLSEEEAEADAAELPTAVQVVTLGEAVDLKDTYDSKTLVCVRGVNERLLLEAAMRAQGAGDTALYVMFVDEVPGLFYPPKTGPSDEAQEVLREACDLVEKHKVTAIPLWRMAHDAGDSIAAAAETLGVTAVFVGTTHRTAIWHLLRGNVLKGLISKLPDKTRLTIVN
jgi:amino acid transporter/nucleotide-binding universal stress UspA family protein